MDIHCPHFEKCSGCQFNVDVGNIPLYREAQTFFEGRGVSLPPLRMGSPVGWRTRAKLAIRGSSDDPQIGLFEEGTHHVVDIPHCRVHHPSINKVVEKLKQWIKLENISLYREGKHDGILRYIQCSVVRETGLVELVLVLNNPIENEKLIAFFQHEKHLLHSLWVNMNQRTDNVIFGKEWKFIAGEPLLWERLCGISVCFHPACFCQANLDMYEQLLYSLQKLVANESVLELYAGVGSIGLSLLDRASQVKCVEITPEALQCFEMSVSKLSKKLQQKISFQVAPVDGSLLHRLTPSVLIVDPPRKGIDRSLMKDIVTSDLQKLIYVSCGWPSFQRDCDELMKVGWFPTFVEAFLFFPGTNHLELLALFQKKNTKL